MSTVTEIKATLIARYPAPDVIGYGPWYAVPAFNGVQQPGLVECWCVVRHFVGDTSPMVSSFRLIAVGNGADTDTCYVEAVSAEESDNERFYRLANEWVTARVATGWFVQVDFWGSECALGWGINETGVAHTAKLVWTDSSKTSISAILDVPHPTAPFSYGGYGLLSDGSTDMQFGRYDVVRVTPTTSATFTSAVPSDTRDRTVYLLTSGTTSYTVTFGAGFAAQGTLTTGATSNRIWAVTFRSNGTKLYEKCRTTTGYAP